MAGFRTKVVAQDRVLAAIRTAASAETRPDVAAIMLEIADQLARRWGVVEGTPS